MIADRPDAPAPAPPARRAAALTCCVCGETLPAHDMGLIDRGPDRLHECAQCWGEDDP